MSRTRRQLVDLDSIPSVAARQEAYWMRLDCDVSDWRQRFRGRLGLQTCNMQDKGFREQTITEMKTAWGTGNAWFQHRHYPEYYHTWEEVAIQPS